MLTIAPAKALEVLAATTHEWLKRWDEGATFPSIRRAWLDRAGPTGRKLVVQIGADKIEGTYAGLDLEGALQLKTDSGTRTVMAGDVFFTH